MGESTDLIAARAKPQLELVSPPSMPRWSERSGALEGPAGSGRA